LITVSEKNATEANMLIPLCCDYMRDLYNRGEFKSHYGKMMGIEVTSDEILRDMKEFIALRARK
jgi:hypothetical protein